MSKWQQKLIESVRRTRGLRISKQEARAIGDVYYEPELAWLIRFKLPFSWAASKNSIYGRMSDQHARIYIRQQARAYRDNITLLTKSAMQGVDLKHDKLWIDIFVEKNKQIGDAINVVELVCDGIKRAIPLDDRWYSLRRVDWSINKIDPQLFIGLGQEIGTQNSKACSHCGRIRPISEFTFYKKGSQGRGHICVECRAPHYVKGPNKINR